MNDAAFEFGAIPNRYPDQVQRIAVLYRLQKQCENNEAITDAVKRLVGRWRARVSELTQAGWQPSATGDIRHHIMYARNCKPTFVMSNPKTRTCHNRLVCPFCYARWVRDVWEVVDRSFPPGTRRQIPSDEEGRLLRAIELDPEAPIQETGPATEFRFQLVLRQSESIVPVVPVENDMPAEQHLELLLRSVVENRKVITEMVDPVGAFMYTTVEPSEDRAHWVFKNRQLFKLEQTQEIPERLVTNSKVIHFMRPTRAYVLWAVAKACTYPTGLMQGDPDMVVKLLAIRNMINFKGSAKIRSFRGGGDV